MQFFHSTLYSTRKHIYYVCVCIGSSNPVYIYEYMRVCVCILTAHKIEREIDDMAWYGITTPNKMQCVCVCACAGKINEGATSDNNNMAAAASVAVISMVVFCQVHSQFQ